MQDTIETLLEETRVFPPPPEFAVQANVSDPAIYAKAAQDPEAFWAEWAGKLDWFERWHTVCDWSNPPFAKWFVGGKLNACYNCVDRHAAGPRANKTAILWEGEPGVSPPPDPLPATQGIRGEGEPGISTPQPPSSKTNHFEEGGPEVRRITYAELKDQVSQVANALKAMGVRKGDRVCIYMPMVPELAMAMLACARIGAAHSVVFGGFSAESLAERTNDAQAKLIITADGGWRRGSVVPLRKITEDALALGCPSVEKVLILERIGQSDSNRAQSESDRARSDSDQARSDPDPAPSGSDHAQTNPGNASSDSGKAFTDPVNASLIPDPQSQIQAPDWIWWHDIVPQQPTDCPCEPMDSEDLLFILYTSGSTGKPKGIVHTTGGYLTGVYATSQWVFDLKEDDVYWCTADCGWVTGHSYIVYGPMANGATCVMYEGAPDSPDKDRFWRIIERHKVTILYTAPTAIRAFMKWGEQYPSRCDLSSLRLLGSVGEPINPEAWIWYHQFIGGGRCPVVDTWWQTETGCILITPLPGITPTKPGSATQPFPGIHAGLADDEGRELNIAHGRLAFYAVAGGDGTDGTNFPHKPQTTDHQPQEAGGILTITRPWPSMARGIFNDPERFKQTYWARFPGLYFPGDGAKVDEDGYFWLLGRVDDIMLVAGHNISTMEVESALVDHPSVAEAAVIGRTHELKGQAIAAFVILKTGETATVDELKAHVARKIGALARPEDIFISADLPKTRSGKIMRRLLRDVAEGRALGDTTTLADPAVVAALKDKYEATES